MLHIASNRNFLFLGLLLMPLFVLYDILLISYTIYIPTIISAPTLILALVSFGLLLFFLVRRFSKFKRWIFWQSRSALGL